jgi:hypothetical protein
MNRETNPPSKPNPLARDFLESKRKSAKGYACPFCTDIYTQEPRIWRHGLQNHRMSLGNLETQEKTEEARRQFRQQALEKGYVVPHTTLLPYIIFDSTCLPTDSPAAAETGALTWQPSRQNKAKSDKAAPAPGERSRWESSYDSTQNTGRNIGDDVSPNSLTNPATVSEEKNTSTIVENPRKRGAEGDSGSLGLPNEGLTRGSMISRSRHNRAHSGGLAIGGDPGHSPQSTQREDNEFVRPLAQSTQPLFDPESPEVNVRHNLSQGQHNSKSPFQPSRPFGSSPLTPRLPRQNDHHPMPGVGQSQFKGQPSNARSVQDQLSLPLYFELILIFK